MIDNLVVEELTNALNPEPQDTNNKYSAIVSRIDNENVIWVNIAGSQIETPTASTSAEVKKGDSVIVEWRNNKLYIAGNYSNPSAGAIRVDAVEIAAQVANTAAQNAVADAGVAREAADSAQSSATAAKTIAEGVEAIAKSAKTAADTAFTNLSQVQSILEVAQWIATHGTYVKATIFNPNATYYTITATQVTEPSDDDKDSQGVLIYYELDNGIYVRTTDTSVDEQKTYYRVTGTPVAQPDAEHIADYYTLAVSEAMADYVQSHLALTDDGLYVMADDSEWKVLVRATGIDIIDGTGVTDVVVATFDNDGTTFYDGQGTDISNITAEFTTSGVRIGSEASTSRMFVSPEGFHIEDDNLLTVADIGKGEAIINRFSVDMEGGRLFGNNRVLIAGRSNPDAILEASCINPVGTIHVSIPWEVRSYLGNIDREGILTFDFSAGVSETLWDDTNRIRAQYDANDNLIKVGIPKSGATSYDGYIFSRIITDRILSYASKKSFGMAVAADDIITPVRGVVAIEEGGIKRTHTSIFNTIPSEGNTVSDNFTLGSYSYSVDLTRENSILTMYVRMRTNTTAKVTVKANSTYMAVRWKGLVLSSKPTVEYYGTSQAPYYSFGQRVGNIKGAYSLINGQGLEAQYPFDAVFGKYNEDNEDYAFHIGNGENENALSNAFGVKWDGGIDFALDTTAQSGDDHDIYTALQTLGWDNDVIV